MRKLPLRCQFKLSKGPSRRRRGFQRRDAKGAERRRVQTPIRYQNKRAARANGRPVLRKDTNVPMNEANNQQKAAVVKISMRCTGMIRPRLSWGSLSAGIAIHGKGRGSARPAD